MTKSTEKTILYISIVLNVVLFGALMMGVVDNEDDDLTRDMPSVVSPPKQNTISDSGNAPKTADSKPVDTKSDTKTDTVQPIKPLAQKIEPVISKTTVPKDIHPGQITKIIENKYALVVRRSMNVSLSNNVPEDFDTTFGGVLLWNSDTGVWEKFLSVTDVNPSDKNNPIDLWFEAPGGPSRILYLRVKDQNGAGSGEGVVKTLTPKNVEMSGWSIVQCYYHANDTGDGAPINKSSSQCQNAIITVVSQ